MPILTITLRGTELEKETTLLLERPYKFAKLKLQHIYHNIDSKMLASKVDAEQQVQLFIRLGGLVDSSKQIINYVGDFNTMSANNVNTRYTDTGEQSGQGTLSVISQSDASVQVYQANTNRQEPAVIINHIIPIGASRHDSKEIISRDLFKQLHDGPSPLIFDGELVFSVHYMDHTGAIIPMDTTTGGIETDSTKGKHITYMTLIFEYEEHMN